jgi:translation elongation factor EF-G
MVAEETLARSEKDPKLEEWSGSPSNCEPPPGPKYAEASILCISFYCLFYCSFYCSQAELTDVYLMMGRGLEALEEVTSGNVLAIGGLDTCILKCATLSTTLNCRPFASMMFQAAPIVQVNFNPKYAETFKQTSKRNAVKNL